MKVILIVLCLSCVLASQSVHMKDLSTITLYQGEYTTGRRVAPIPQLKCVGGTAGSYGGAVKSMQCHNQGFDGMDINWKCESTLPSQYQLGKVKVLCEGYNHATDEYILAGSCGAEYELDYNPNYRGPNHKVSNRRDVVVTTWWDPLTGMMYETYRSNDGETVVVLILVFTLAVLFWLAICSITSNTSQSYSRHPVTFFPDPYPYYSPSWGRWNSWHSWYNPVPISQRVVSSTPHTSIFSSDSSHFSSHSPPDHESTQYARTERR